MKDLAYDPEEPIVALATAWGEGALAVVRTSGPGAIELTANVFSAPDALRNAAGYSLVHGTLVDGQEPVDEVMVAVYRAPKSYTGQESLEIFCHGSMAGIARIIALLKRRGFRDAGPGEFTLRAFLNKKMDLTRAEAVKEIVSARSAEAHGLALHRLSGAVYRRIDAAKRRLTELASAVEIGLDYPEEEAPGEIESSLPVLREVREDLAGLIATYRTGKLYQEGVQIALCGKTNAGKSSLFNLFLREERSIVSEIHGTTRDYIESGITLDGVPIRLYDTAGLRNSQNPIEAEGIRRSGRVIENADLLLYIVDSTVGVAEEDRQFLDSRGVERCIRIWNKVDESQREAPPGFLAFSATSGTGFAELERLILEAATQGTERRAGEVVIDSLRQKELLERCNEALGNVAEGIEAGMPPDAVALDVREALDSLGEITGEVTSADILNTMFAGFCVGK